jgi:hypothetical protein
MLIEKAHDLNHVVGGHFLIVPLHGYPAFVRARKKRD